MVLSKTDSTDVTKTHPIIQFIMLVWLKPHEQIKIVVDEIVKLN